jgi:hypothetical protein
MPPKCRAVAVDTRILDPSDRWLRKSGLDDAVVLSAVPGEGP